MRRCGIFLAATCLAGLLLAGGVSCKSKGQGPSSKVVINGQSFTVEVADTRAKREAGLSNRSSLAADRGMLFLFERPGPLEFYMIDCYFDIDIAFLDADRHIINLETMPVESDPAHPKRLYHSDHPAKYVLETVGGTWKRIGAQPGMTATFIDVPEGAAPAPAAPPPLPVEED